MATAVRYDAVVEPVRDDVSVLRGLVSQLIREPFLFVQESYGDELTLHFGTVRELPGFRGRTIVEGSYVLTTRASGWECKSVPRAEFITDRGTSVALKDLEDRPPVTPGARVVFAEVVAKTGVELVLAFDDGSTFAVSPDPDPDDSDAPLADWELFTPFARVLKVGPGVSWEYAAGDGPLPPPP